MSATRSRLFVLAFVALAVTLAACGGSSLVSPTTTAPPGDRTLDVDWPSRTVTGGDRGEIEVEFCDGDGFFLCFTRGGQHLGGVELTSWPARDQQVIRDVLEAGGTHAEALSALAHDAMGVFRQDRAEGCGADYDVVPVEPEPARVAGAVGLRYGFRGSVQGATVEQVIWYAVIDDDATLWMFVAAAYGDGGCLPREGEFDLEGLDDSADLIADAIAASKLP